MTSLVLGQRRGRKVPAQAPEPAGRLLARGACPGEAAPRISQGGFFSGCFCSPSPRCGRCYRCAWTAEEGRASTGPPVLQLLCDPVNCDTRGGCWASAWCAYMRRSACILRCQAWFIWIFLFSARSFFLTEWKKSLILFPASLFACRLLTHSKENKRED